MDRNNRWYLNFNQGGMLTNFSRATGTLREAKGTEESSKLGTFIFYFMLL